MIIRTNGIQLYHRIVPYCTIEVHKLLLLNSFTIESILKYCFDPQKYITVYICVKKS